MMFAITGITGQVGGATARGLLAAGHNVRAVLRDPKKGSEWVKQGCEVAVAEMTDSAALSGAFSNAEGVFVLIPPVFDPAPGFVEVRCVIAALVEALDLAKPERVVCLSTIGAQSTRANLLNQLGLVEEALSTRGLPIAFLRAAWFMENSAADVRVAMTGGVIRSYLQPLDKPLPMVATTDIGRVAAELMCERWEGRRIVELEGPRRVSPEEIAADLSGILGRQVRVEAVPRAEWEAEFRADGAQNPLPRAQMIAGFNEGWIEFEGGEVGSRKGDTPIEAVLRDLVARG
jgi:NAD(P)H dehydrogenase (quinone)